MIAAVALLVLPVLRDDIPTGHFLCSEIRSDTGETQPWVYAGVEKDERRRLVERALMIKTRNFEATFDAARSTDRSRLTLRSLQLAAWAPPLGAAYPLTVSVFLDSDVVSTQTFAGPNIILVDRVGSVPVETADSAMRWREQPAIDLAPIDLAPIDLAPIKTSVHLFGTNSVNTVVRDKSSAQVAKLRFPAPNWKEIAAFSDQVFPRLEFARSLGRCKPIVAHIGS